MQRLCEQIQYMHLFLTPRDVEVPLSRRRAATSGTWLAGMPTAARDRAWPPLGPTPTSRPDERDEDAPGKDPPPQSWRMAGPRPGRRGTSPGGARVQTPRYEASPWWSA
jgi:hypothetical protein